MKTQELEREDLEQGIMRFFDQASDVGKAALVLAARLISDGRIELGKSLIGAMCRPDKHEAFGTPGDPFDEALLRRVSSACRRDEAMMWGRLAARVDREEDKHLEALLAEHMERRTAS